VRIKLNLLNCLKWTAVCATFVAATASSEARYWSLRGACQDSSQNLYSASYYPTSASLRVTKRNSSMTTTWIKDFAPPSGFKFSSLQRVAVDGSGNVYVATTLYNTMSTKSEFEVLKLTSAGALSTSAVFNDGGVIAAAQQVFLGGLTLDSSGNVYLVGSYNTPSSGPSVACVVKYTSALASPTTRYITTTGTSGYYIYADDIVADGSGNIYVSAYAYPSVGTDLTAIVTKYDSTFSSTPSWQQSYKPVSTAVASGEGCLTYNGSSKLTYVGTYADASNSYRTNMFAVQYSTSGTSNWSVTPSLLDMTAQWSISDSSGDIVVAGTSVGTGYKIAKFNTTTGAVTWSQTFTSSGASPNSLCQDASGDYLVVRNSASGTPSSIVDRFTGSSGAFSTSYTYSSGASGADYGYMVFPSSTAGTFYVSGVGLQSGTYYPLMYKNGGSAGYSSATTP